MRMGKFLLQRGLLIYILTPESCDPYMIFYINFGIVRKRELLRNEAMIDGWC